MLDVSRESLQGIRLEMLRSDTLQSRRSVLTVRKMVVKSYCFRRVLAVVSLTTLRS